VTGDVHILFPWGDDDSPMRREPRSGCQHKNVTLVEDSHKLICRDCDAEVDPFAFLIRLTADWERWVGIRKEAERRARLAVARLEETLRLEQNARARVRRRDPAAKLPEIPWGQGKGSQVW
jgi:hypothetical protein